MAAKLKLGLLLAIFIASSVQIAAASEGKRGRILNAAGNVHVWQGLAIAEVTVTCQCPKMKGSWKCEVEWPHKSGGLSGSSWWVDEGSPDTEDSEAKYLRRKYGGQTINVPVVLSPPHNCNNCVGDATTVRIKLPE